MVNISDRRDCSGCTACYAVCGKSAIEMKSDSLGFKYPVVDTDKCVECGLCEKVCAFNEQYRTPDNFDKPKAYAARHKEITEVEKSRSGGVFAALSDYILARGGVIYGASFDTTFKVVHTRATTRQECDAQRGSKYVQSDMGDTFHMVKSDLQEGRMVLFSGTPCQTAGLTSYLNLRKVNRERLYICDIVCHGVPSPKIWQDYLSYIEDKEKQKIIEVNFRDKKKFGWKAHRESFKLADTYTYTYTYTYTFYKHIMFRPSCGNCHYANLRRTGDITLADFWGWEKTDKDINSDNKGISLIFVNTPHGESLFSAIKDSLTCIPTTVEKAMQPNLKGASHLHPKSQQFEKDYVRFGFRKTMELYGFMGWRYKRDVAISFVRRAIKFVTKRLFR